MKSKLKGIYDKYLINLRIEIIYLIIVIYALNPFRVGMLAPLLLIPFVVSNRSTLIRNKRFMATALVLFFFAGVYVIMGVHFDIFPLRRAIQVLVYPMLFLLLGYIVIEKQSSHKNRIKVFQHSLYAFAFSFGSFSVFSFLNTMITFGGVAQSIKILGGRNVQGLWGGLIPATLLTAFTSLTIFLIPLYFLQKYPIHFQTFIKLRGSDVKRVYCRFTSLSRDNLLMVEGEVSKKAKIHFIIKRVWTVYLIFMFIVALYSTFIMGSRTIILMILISSVINLFIFEKLKFTKKLSLIIIFFITFFFITFSFNIGGLRDWMYGFSIYSVSLSERLIASFVREDIRIIMWRKVISGLSAHPLGGRLTNIPLAFAHNLWLDVAWETGIITLLLLVLFTLLSLIKVIKVFLKYNIMFFRAFITQIAVILLILFFMEPVLQIFPTYFVLFCFFIGQIYKFDDYLAITINRDSELEGENDDDFIHNSDI